MHTQSIQKILYPAILAAGLMGGVATASDGTVENDRSSSLTKILATTILVGASGVGGYGAAKFLEGREARELRESLEKTSKALQKVEREFERSTDDNESLTSKLTEAVKARKNALKNLEASGSEVNNLKDNIAALQGDIRRLKAFHASETKSLVDELEAIKGVKVQLEQDLVECEETIEKSSAAFDLQVKQEVNRQYRQELTDLLKKSQDLALRTRDWSNRLIDHHEDRIETAKQVVNKFVSTEADEVRSLKGELEASAEYASGLKLRVANLQRQLDRELIEPVYANAKYDKALNLANDLARNAFTISQVPLEVQGATLTDGNYRIGFGYSQNQDVSTLERRLNAKLDIIRDSLRLVELSQFKKSDIANTMVCTARTEPRIKDADISHLVGSSEEFIRYVTSNDWRYRLIADPGAGKTPTTAVMVSKMLAAGARMGNVKKGKKVPHTLVTVSYPGANSSLKDGDTYPLAPFLKYGEQTQAVKSFGDAIADYEFREQNPRYAAEFFHLYIWDEFDNTLADAKDSKALADKAKKLLKDGGHKNIGYIVSGQSVMTSTIPGFMTDDRSLFTEIIIGINKIRTYLNTYGKGKGSDATLAKLATNMDVIEQFMESKNRLITDSARELRLALVVAGQSPKLFFLPNFDDVVFDIDTVSNSEELAVKMKGQIESGEAGIFSPDLSPVPGKVKAESHTQKGSPLSQGEILKKDYVGIGGETGNPGQVPHCPTCDISLNKPQKDGRRYCTGCKKTISKSKMINK